MQAFNQKCEMKAEQFLKVVRAPIGSVPAFSIAQCKHGFLIAEKFTNENFTSFYCRILVMC